VGSDGDPVADESAPSPGPAPVRPRRKLLPFAVLAGGALIAAYLGSKSPRDQHLRLVLGPDADHVTGLEVQYVTADGDVARDARMTFPPGQTPRIVSHEPQLADGDYRVRIELDTREGRRSVERRVTLGGGTTQVDLAGVVSSPPASETPPPHRQPPSDPQPRTVP
jgi:hypothetical protein